MRTVLGFDSWTGGVRKFSRLVPAFRQLGMELRLLHTGSWGGDVTRPKEEFICEMLVRDVSWYDGKSLLEILKMESPAAVLFLSNDVFTHRAFNRYCVLLNIPTIRLYHGLVEIQSTTDDQLYNVNLIAQLLFVLKRVPKALFKVWPLYMHALCKTHADPQDWKRFAIDIFHLTTGKYIQVASRDSRTNACAVYTEADVSHAMKKYGYPRADVHIVGNPDLIDFKLSDQLLGIANSTARIPVDEIVYIDTGLIYTGMVFSGRGDFVAHLVELAKTLAVHGLKLAIKLHPQHYQTDLPAEILKQGFRIVLNHNFVDSLLRCRSVMVEPSTAALVPCLLGLPVLMVAFGKLRNQRFGKVLMDYPRGALINDAAAVMPTIARIEQETKPEVDLWIRKNSGPLPADEMPSRVAEIVRKTVFP